MPRCVICGDPLSCTHVDRHTDPLEKPCALKKGAIWVHVMNDLGDSLEGVRVDVADSEKPTEPSGFVRFDPLEAERYTATLLPLPGNVALNHDLPESTTRNVWLSQGEIAYLAFSLRRKATLKVKVVKQTDHLVLFSGATATVTGHGDPGDVVTVAGIADYGKRSAGPYTVKVALSDPDNADYFAPTDAAPFELLPGEDEPRVVEIAKRPCPTLAISVPAIAVGGAAATLTTGADLPYAGRGLLTVTKGSASIAILGLVDDKIELDAGATVNVTARDHSALDGVEFEWKLTSIDVPVSAQVVTCTLTVVKAELVVENLRGVMPSDVKQGDGAVIHVQDLAGARKRLKVTPVCKPDNFAGSLQITVVGDKVTAHDAPDHGGPVDLATPIVIGADLAPFYLQGRAVSAAVRDTELQLAIVDLADNVDRVKVTVVQIKLEVYGGTPGPSDPTAVLDAAAKSDLGRRIYVQNTVKWWWGRARVQILKDPPDAPCKLNLRKSGAGDVRLFPATGGVGNVPLDVHRVGEVALGMPLELAVDAIRDAAVGVSYWAEGVTASGRLGKHDFHLDLVDFDEGCDHLAFRVYPPLFEYDRINVMDLGGPGSGHQAAVLKLLGSVAAVGYRGDVVLSYNRKKTKIYANGLAKGADLNGPVTSYALYFAEWTGICQGMNVRCLPVGTLDLTLTPAETIVFTDVNTFWTQHAWPTAAPALNAVLNPGGFGAPAAQWRLRQQWSSSNVNLARDQAKFRQDKVYKQETGAAMAPDTDLLALAPAVLRTLSAFGAMDFHAHDDIEAALPNFKTDYFDAHWLPVLQRMTVENHPVAMLFQPFLWTGGHPMQVRQDTRALYPVDVTAKVVAGGAQAAYGLTLPDPAGDDGIIAGLAAVPQAVLTKAKAGTAHLVSAYYGGSVSDIDYTNLLRVLVRVIKAANPGQKVMIALIGDDMPDAHTAVAAELADVEVVARLDGADSGPGVKVELAHIGRTTAMLQFERYSCLFITEGANTWQELLTLGTPALSVKPGGNTRPWEQVPPAGPGVEAKEASDNLIAAQDPNVNTDVLLAYFNKVIDPGSDVSVYFDAWATLLSDPHSDQVVTAVNYLPDPDVPV